MLNETVAPALARAGMPVIPVESTPPEEDARNHRRRQGFQAWLLDLLEWSLDVPPPARRTATRSPTARPRTPRPSRPSAWKAACPRAGAATIIPLQGAEPKRPLQKQLARRLRRWHGKSPTRACKFACAGHPRATSCASKRLRYSLAFAESLLPAAKLRGYRKLRRACRTS